MTGGRRDAEERRVRVTIQFEASRLSGVYLAEAYELVAPQRGRPVVRGSERLDGLRDTDTGRGA